MVATFRQPFDSLAKTNAAVARSKGRERRQFVEKRDLAVQAVSSEPVSAEFPYYSGEWAGNSSGIDPCNARRSGRPSSSAWENGRRKPSLRLAVRKLRRRECSILRAQLSSGSASRSVRKAVEEIVRALREAATWRTRSVDPILAMAPPPVQGPDLLFQQGQVMQGI